jgi:hypothetical protein
MRTLIAKEHTVPTLNWNCLLHSLEVKITWEENFMTVFPEIFWSSREISFICKQESAREGELSEDRFMTSWQ